MEIKASFLGVLLYSSLLLYAISAVLMTVRGVKIGKLLFFWGFIFNFSALIYRWVSVDHLPMQTLFEIFLWLTALVYPLSCFTKKYIDYDTFRLDVFIALVLVFPAAFVFDGSPRQLPPALQSAFFGPHVAAYMFSYVLMFKASALSILAMWSLNDKKNMIMAEKRSYKLVCLGFPLLTLGLLLGCFWAKVAWGRFWGWDPKELWSFISWLAFVLYFHYRYQNGTKRVLINHLLVNIGMFFIVVTLVWVNLSRIFTGLHNYAS
ncbi:MAG: cytochrome c biogenesis protein CcsA [Sedimentisphaeraceae bacterium JB056]